MDIDLFRRLCETPGIPGREERVRALIAKETKGLYDSATTDAMGSLIATRKPTRKGAKGSKPVRVMLAAHMDEIGFFVRHVDENGCIWVNPAGGFDTLLPLFDPWGTLVSTLQPKGYLNDDADNGGACREAVADPATGLPWAPDLTALFGLQAPPPAQIAAYAALERGPMPLNTCVAVIATDAALTKSGCRRVAVAAQDGLARAIRPSHTPLDGDTVFVLATGAVDVAPSPDTPEAMAPDTRLVAAVSAAAADCLARAVLAGVLDATTVAGIPTYRDALPGAFGTGR